MPHRRARRKSADVELNLAAMLDMAFQLLTFFILTFKPAPVEGQLELRLPPPQPLIAGGKIPPGETSEQPASTLLHLNTLVISILPTDTGEIQSLAIGEGRVAGLAQLDARLKAAFSDPASTFDQVVVQVGSSLRYEQLMKVVDICSRQKLTTGQPLRKLSFVEIP
jgi:biopolymer transport protein ExbD